MGHRRKAREYALQALYIYETANSSVHDLVKLDWLDKEIADDIKNFTVELINGSIANIDNIDNIIRKYSRNWEFERLDVIDKSILRLSVFCLLHLPDIPEAVTITEGVELGKKYGGEASGKFINGILDSVKGKELHR